MVDIIDLSEPQNHRCCYCGHEMIRHRHVDGQSVPKNAMTKDHFEPRTYGGKTTTQNMIAACCLCNYLRGEMEAEAFYNLVQKLFRRDSTLRSRWYEQSRIEVGELKMQCRNVHARQLRGRGRRHIEYAFRHYDFALRSYQRYPLRA